jgi:hypothetical protein
MDPYKTRGQHVQACYTEVIRKLYGSYTGRYTEGIRVYTEVIQKLYGSIRIAPPRLYGRVIQSSMPNVTALQILYTEIYTETTHYSKIPAGAPVLIPRTHVKRLPRRPASLICRCE